jgi:uncharacterized membrane protein
VATAVGSNGRLAPDAEAAITCPICGGESPPDAVFCADPACHKALGEFSYVQEEVAAATGWHERLADRVTGFIGKPHFVLVHLFWFAAWIAVNSGIVMIGRRFDEYPFALLALALSIEAILLSGFILISNNRQAAFADKRAELDYEVNVRSFRAVQRLSEAVEAISARIERLETGSEGSHK